MLNIFANAINTATRMGPVHTPSNPAASSAPKKNWLPKGHWFLQRDKDFRPTNQRRGPSEF